MDLAQKDLNLVTVITRQMVASLPAEKIVNLLQARVATNAPSPADRLALGQALFSANHPSEARKWATRWTATQSRWLYSMISSLILESLDSSHRHIGTAEGIGEHTSVGWIF